MKFITLILLSLSLVTVSAAASASNKVGQFPTAEQLLPPITAATEGFVLSNGVVNNKRVVKWVPPFIQIQSDWNQTDATKADYIKNKPAPTPKPDWRAPQGSSAEILNKPLIPEQLQADWNQTNETAKDYIKGKPTIPVLPNLAPVALSGKYQDLIDKPSSTSGFGGVNAQVGVAYTLSVSDANKVVTFKNAAPVVLTIPLNLAVEDGTVIEGAQLDYGWVSIVGAPDVKIISQNEAYKTDSIGSSFKLKKIAANTWLLTGDLRSDKQTVPVGKTVILTATALNGTTPYTYQWKKNGVDISGANQVSLALYSVTSADAGIYICAMTNTVGTSVSEPATIIVKL